MMNIERIATSSFAHLHPAPSESYDCLDLGNSLDYISSTPCASSDPELLLASQAISISASLKFAYSLIRSGTHSSCFSHSLWSSLADSVPLTTQSRGGGTARTTIRKPRSPVAYNRTQALVGASYEWHSIVLSDYTRTRGERRRVTMASNT